MRNRDLTRDWRWIYLEGIGHLPNVHPYQQLIWTYMNNCPTYHVNLNTKKGRKRWNKWCSLVRQLKEQKEQYDFALGYQGMNYMSF